MDIGQQMSARVGMIDEIRYHYWASLTKQHDSSAWNILNAAYNEPQRAYHAWSHIDDLLHKLDEFCALAARPDLIAIAIFWHDAVYATRNRDGSARPDVENVRDSDALFRRHTIMGQEDVEAVSEMIMASANHLDAIASREIYPGFARDLDLFLDLDLSSLGAPWETFAENLDKIRFEFAWVPEAMFCFGRLEMLDRFAKKGALLFRREEMRAVWLDAARRNISRTTEELRAQMSRLSSQN
jgi:predicted metal-dependent HD superfamily phosphohydrolase